MPLLIYTVMSRGRTCLSAQLLSVAQTHPNIFQKQQEQSHGIKQSKWIEDDRFDVSKIHEG
jgi:hypothetical protein